MRNKFSVYLFALCFSMLSCDSNRVFDEYQSVPDQWNKDAIISFNVKVPDTISPYNVFVNIRNTNDYKYSNLFLMVEMNFPNGKISRDTLEYKMAKPNGELLGTGYTGIKENKLWYKKALIFKEKGEYRVKIQHAMRENGKVKGVENLEGITDIGFRIEKTTTN